MSTDRYPTRARVLDLLADCRRDAGQPGFGTREVEIARAFRPHGKIALRLLTQLREVGKVVRGSGFVWLTEEAFAECERGRTST